MIAKAQSGSDIGCAAGGLTTGLLSYNDALSHLLYGKGTSELSADEKMLISNIASMISNREIQLAVPATTTQAQWTEINRAIEYGKGQDVKVIVT